MQVQVKNGLSRCGTIELLDLNTIRLQSDLYCFCNYLDTSHEPGQLFTRKVEEVSRLNTFWNNKGMAFCLGKDV